MTRAEIEEAYEIENGMIRSPGKFEGEAVYAPHFHDCCANGFGETLFWCDETSSDIIEIDADDRAAWPEIGEGTAAIIVIESEQGFVHCEEVTTLELEQYRERNAREAAESVEEEG